MKNQTIIISLGGSLIVPHNVDIKFLTKFKKVILNFIAKKNKVILICGGGSVCRQYQQAVKQVNPKVSNLDLDWLGIDITQLNALAVKLMFGKYAASQILINPTKKIKTSQRIIIGSGWKPGCSSDKDAVLAAKTYNCKTVINLSNIKYVYDKDPRQHKNARRLPKLSWPEFRKIIGHRWVPGANVPFDPVAAGLAQKLGLKLVIMKGSDLGNFKKFLNGEKFQGTIVASL
jgi:uridylate kinase